MNAYADTSFLISLYIEDANSAAADSLVRLYRPTFLLTPFGEAEFSNAVELRVFRAELTKSQARVVRDEFLSDLRAGVLHSEELGREVWQTARRLVRRRTARLGSRTLDVLHVATALVLKPDAFCTFDERQRRLARAERLRVLPG